MERIRERLKKVGPSLAAVPIALLVCVSFVRAQGLESDPLLRHMIQNGVANVGGSALANPVDQLAIIRTSQQRMGSWKLETGIVSGTLKYTNVTLNEALAPGALPPSAFAQPVSVSVSWSSGTGPGGSLAPASYDELDAIVKGTAVGMYVLAPQDVQRFDPSPFARNPRPAAPAPEPSGQKQPQLPDVVSQADVERQESLNPNPNPNQLSNNLERLISIQPETETPSKVGDAVLPGILQKREGTGKVDLQVVRVGTTPEPTMFSAETGRRIRDFVAWAARQVPSSEAIAGTRPMAGGLLGIGALVGIPAKALDRGLFASLPVITGYGSPAQGEARRKPSSRAAAAVLLTPVIMGVAPAGVTP